MSNRLIIARARPVDVAAATELFIAYQAFYRVIVDAGKARAFVSDRLRLNDTIFLLARFDNTPTHKAVGFVQMMPKLSSTSMRRDWVVNDLFVAEQHRRQGIATALMNESLAFAKRTGAAKMSLKTQADNAAARALYEREGWELDAEFVTYTLRV
jgi:ribosomal protein S18 acetylase RimI-like enzyme